MHNTDCSSSSGSSDFIKKQGSLELHFHVTHPQGTGDKKNQETLIDRIAKAIFTEVSAQTPIVVYIDLSPEALHQQSGKLEEASPIEKRICQGVKTVSESNEKSMKDPLFSILAVSRSIIPNHPISSSSSASQSAPLPSSAATASSVKEPSLLDTLDLTTLTRLVANIHGDLFISHSGFEGQNQGIAMSSLKEIAEKHLLTLKGCQGDAQIKAHAEALQTFISKVERGIASVEGLGVNPPDGHNITLAKRMIAMLKELKVGEGILFPGGWAGIPAGHAVYFDITRTAAGFTLHVFNTGDGIEPYHCGIKAHRLGVTQPGEQDYITRYLPYLIIPNISENRMFNPLFWRAAFDMNAYSLNPINNKPLVYKAFDLYKRLVACLGNPKEINDAPYAHYIEEQRSGTCGWSGLRAVALCTLPNTISQKIIYEFKLAALKKLYAKSKAKVQTHLVENEEIRTLLHKSVTQLALDVRTLYASQIIDLDEFEHVNAFAAEVLQAIHAGEKEVKALQQSRTLQLSYSNTFTTSFPSIIYSIKPFNLNDDGASLDRSMPSSWDPNWKPDSASLYFDLMKFYSFCTKDLKKFPTLAITHMMEFFSKLPVPQTPVDTFWDSIPQSHVIYCMSIIVQLNTCLNALGPSLPPRKLDEVQFIFLKSFAIIHKAASRCPEIPSEMIKANWHIELNKLAPLRMFDPNLIKQYQALCSYLNNISRFYKEWLAGVSSYWKSSTLTSGIARTDAEYVTKHVEKVWSRQNTNILMRYFNELRKKQRWILPADQRATILMAELDPGELPVAYVLLKNQALLMQFFKDHLWLIKLDIDRTDSRLSIKPNSSRIDQFPADASDEQWQLYDKNLGELAPKMSIEEFRKNITARSTDSLDDAFWVSHTPTQELGYIPSELQVVKAIDYYSKNFLLLIDDPAAQFKIRQFIFCLNALERLLNYNPKLALRLVDFIQSGYQFFQECNILSAQLHFVYYAIMLQARLEPLAKKHPAIQLALQKLHKEGLDHVRHLDIKNCLEKLLKSCSDIEVKSRIHRQLLLLYSTELAAAPDSAFKHELPAIVASLVYANTFPVAKSSSHIDSSIDLITSRVLPFLKETNLRSGLMTAIARKTAETLGIEDSVAAKLKWDSMEWDFKAHPTCIGTIGGVSLCRFNVLNFTVKFGNQSFSQLPGHIVNNPLFLRIFTSAPKNVRVYDNFVYEFEDEQGCLVRICSTNIQKQFKKDGAWYEYLHLDSEMHGSPILKQSKILGEKYTHWMSGNDAEIVLCPLKTSTIRYRIVSKDAGYSKLIDEHKPHVCLLPYVKDAPSPIYAFFQNIESLEYVHVWVNDKDQSIHSIDLPRLNLNFELTSCKLNSEEAAKPRAKCKQITGYWLADNQYLSALGTFRDYIVLQNAEGKTKIVIPRAPINIVSRGGLVSEMVLTKNFSDAEGSKLPPYFEYTVNARGELQAQHAGGYLFYAYLLIGKGDYAKALFHLRQNAYKLKKYTGREQEIFEWIDALASNTKFGNDPKLLTLRLAASSLQMQGQAIHGEGSLLKAANTYEDYLRFKKNLGSFLLTPHEERIILRYRHFYKGALTSNPFFQNQLFILEANTPHPPRDDLPTISAISGQSIEYTLPGIEMLAPDAASDLLDICKVNDLSVSFIWMSNERDNNNPNLIHELYEIVKDPSLSISAKIEHVESTAPLINGHAKDCYFLLRAVAYSPDDFPSWNELSQILKNKDIKFIEDLFKKAGHLLIKHSSTTKSDKTIAVSPVLASNMKDLIPACTAAELGKKLGQEVLESLFTQTNPRKLNEAAPDLKLRFEMFFKKYEHARKQLIALNIQRMEFFNKLVGKRSELTVEAHLNILFEEDGFGLKDRKQQIIGLYPAILNPEEILRSYPKCTQQMIEKEITPLLIELLEILNWEQKLIRQKNLLSALYEQSAKPHRKTADENQLLEEITQKAIEKICVDLSSHQSQNLTERALVLAFECINDDDANLNQRQRIAIMHVKNACELPQELERVYISTTHVRIENILKEVGKAALGRVMPIHPVPMPSRVVALSHSDPIYSKLLPLSPAIIQIARDALNDNFNTRSSPPSWNSVNAHSIQRGLKLLLGHYHSEFTKLEVIQRELHQQIFDLASKKWPDSAAKEEREAKAFHISAVLSENVAPFMPETVIQDLIYACLRHKLGELKKRNPNLNEEDLKQLPLMLANYLEHATAAQALNRQRQALHNLAEHLAQPVQKRTADHGLIEKDLINAAVQELRSRPAYTVEKDSEKTLLFLVFEFCTGLRLRENQVASIEKLIKAGFAVEQLIMGAGKSKIILPLLALLQADGNSLPVIITPAPLFDTTAQDLSSNMQIICNKRLNSLFFARNSDFSPERLNDLYKFLNTIISNRECLMMKGKSLRVLHLKFIETLLAFANQPSNTTLNKQIQEFQNILKLFATKAKAIIDEPHLVLDARTQVNFTLGKNASLDAEKCHLIVSLYRLLLAPEFQKIIGTHPLDSFTMSDEAYKKEMLPLLQERMLAQKPFAPILKSASESERKHILEYLNNENSSIAEKFVKSTPIAEELALLREELNRILPKTLCKRYRVDFGPSQKKQASAKVMLPIPYDGNNSPVEGAEFLSPEAVANYAIQMYWKRGVSASDIKRCLELLKAQAKTSTNPQEQAAAYRRFAELCGEKLRTIELLHCTSQDYELIAQRLNSARFSADPAPFFEYLAQYILPEIKFTQKQLNSSTCDLIGMLPSAVGLTGTPWNSDTYPDMLRKNTHKQTQIDKQTIELMQKKTGEAQDGIRLIKSASYPEILEALVRPDDDALIEIGALLNGLSNEQVARDVLNLLIRRKSNKKGVVFFQKNTLAILEKTETGVRIVAYDQSDLKPEERFTYYDQTHATGADIPQHLRAKATQTIGKDTTIRDASQGFYRMRGVDKQQTVSFVVHPDAIITIRNTIGRQLSQPMNPDHLFTFLEANGKALLAIHALLSIKQKITYAMKKVVLDYLLKTEITDKNRDSVAKLIQETSTILTESLPVSAWDKYGKSETLLTREQIIENMVNSAVAKLEAISAQSPLFQNQKNLCIQKIRKEIAVELQGTADVLPSHLSTREASGALDMQGEQEQEQEQEQEIQMQAHAMRIRETDWDYLPKPWSSPNKSINIFAVSTYTSANNAIPVHALEVILKKYPNLKSMTSLAQGLLVSENRKADSPDGLQGLSQIPAQYVLHIRDKKRGRMQLMFLEHLSDLSFFWTALSQNHFPEHLPDISFFWKPPSQNRPKFSVHEVELCISDLNGNILQADSSIDSDNLQHPFRKAFDTEGMDLRVRAKLIMGELNYSEAELLHIQRLLKESDAKAIDEYFTQHILKLNPKKKESYEHSPLFELLRRAGPRG